MKQENTSTYNPYHPKEREGKGEPLSLIRYALIGAIIILVGVALMTIYSLNHHKYELVKSKAGLYIFDKNTGVTNYCNAGGCIAISNGFLIPSKSMPYRPGNGLQSFMQGYHDLYPKYPANGYPIPPLYPPAFPSLPLGYMPPYYMPQPYAMMPYAPAPVVQAIPTPLRREQSTPVPVPAPSGSPETVKIIPDEDMGAVVVGPSASAPKNPSTPSAEEARDDEQVKEKPAVSGGFNSYEE